VLTFKRISGAATLDQLSAVASGRAKGRSSDKRVRFFAKSWYRALHTVRDDTKDACQPGVKAAREKPGCRQSLISRPSRQLGAFGWSRAMPSLALAGCYLYCGRLATRNAADAIHAFLRHIDRFQAAVGAKERIGSH
jgi:hypothetical protein